MNDLDSTADRFAVGELYPEDLPMAAAEALAQGYDTPALVELACLHRTETGEAPALFRTALAELGLVADTEAAWSARDVDVRMRRAEKAANALLAGEGILVEHLSRIASDLDYLSVTPEAGSPELADLAADFDGFRWHLDDDTIDQALLRDDIHARCRTLSAGQPWVRPVAATPTPTKPRWWRVWLRGCR
ncbi:hypothetical protein [Nocardia sp. NPDC051833]|uniref:hypothetical protein n=1 Tax=Nocardia sp. NPDC051833 TaxID=3155674 RepID=UPI0034283EF8